jgi:RimJ/RimL family protein N-acetyltransferase
MSFAEQSYQATLPDGLPLVLRKPTQAEFDPLFPVPRGTLEFGLDGLETERFIYEPDADMLLWSLDRTETTVAWGIHAYGRMVGYAGLYTYEEGYPGGFTYLLDKTVWGRGVGTTARAVTVHHLFADPTVLAAEAFAHPDNVRSRGMLRSLGFQLHEPADHSRAAPLDRFMLPRPGILWRNRPPELDKVQTMQARWKHARRIGPMAIREITQPH